MSQSSEARCERGRTTGVLHDCERRERWAEVMYRTSEQARSRPWGTLSDRFRASWFRMSDALMEEAEERDREIARLRAAIGRVQALADAGSQVSPDDLRATLREAS